MSNSMNSFSDYAHMESLSPRVSEFVSVQKPPESLTFAEVMREFKQDAPSTKNAPTNPFAQLAEYLKSLPENERVDAKFLVEAARANSALKRVLENAQSVRRTGNHIEIERQEAQNLAIGRDILEGNASADKLNIEKNLAFDVAPDGKGITDVRGLSLSVNAFGSGRTLPITRLDFAAGGNAHPEVVAHIENPLPYAARDIFSMQKTIAVPLETENGQLKFPQPSKVFQAVADSTGDTLPGMMFSDAFQDLSDISKFAEKNPKWIHDVIKPMFEEVKRQATSRSEGNSTNAQDGQPGPATSQDGNSADGITNEPAEGTPSDKTTAATSKDGNDLEKITGPGDYEQTITVDGRERRYSIHVPPGYDGSKPIPLLLMLHGRGGNGKEFAERTHMNEIADKEGFAVAYPDATKWLGRQDLSAWDAANGLVPPGGRANDMEFLRKVIERSQNQLDIDEKRIYMIGHSSGGMMTYLAASQMSDKLAAVGIVSSAMSGKEPKPKFPVSVISTHGTDDEVIPINGLKDVPPILSELGIPTFNTPQFATDFWKRQNGITEAGTTKTEGATTEKHFENKQNGTAVEEITFKNSGHTPDEKLHVYDRIWSFLEQHPKASGKVAPSNDPKELVDARPNPLQKVFDNIQKRGADGIAEDVSKIYTQVAALPNGSIYPSKILADAESKLGSKVENPVTDLIENSTELSKNSSQIELKTTKPSEFPINEKVSIATINSLTLDNVKFNLDSHKGNPKLSNIQGVSLELSALGRDFRTNLHHLTDQEDDKGRHTYNFNMDNPIPTPLRWLMLAPSTVNLGMQVDNSGNVKVGNQDQLMDELLGKNPITRGYLDEIGDMAQFIRNPGSESFPALRKDIGITGGMMGLGMLAPRYRIPISIAGGLIAAPAVIHFLHDKYQ